MARAIRFYDQSASPDAHLESARKSLTLYLQSKGYSADDARGAAEMTVEGLFEIMDAHENV